MCRWVAYAGPEIYLVDLIFHQEHSIVSQSLAATQSAWVTNAASLKSNLTERFLRRG